VNKNEPLAQKEESELIIVDISNYLSACQASDKGKFANLSNIFNISFKNAFFV
jgi:hypothetical protein